MVRYFCHNFKNGGRLYGGVWQQLSKSERKNLFIDGKSLITIDYSQMNPNLMYGIVKEEPPLEDSYRIPGFEEHRDGIKLVFNSSLFRKTNMTRFPIGSKCLFSTGAKIEEVLGSIKKVHPKISHMLNTELGYELFYLESRFVFKF